MKLLGLRTLIYNVDDLAAAKNWYSKFLNRRPYFDEPFYVGFNVGGFEVGLVPSDKKVKIGDNVETYLGVPNMTKAHEEALKLGAKIHAEPKEVGEGIIVATYLDPFGNIIGLIENQNFNAE